MAINMAITTTNENTDTTTTHQKHQVNMIKKIIK